VQAYTDSICTDDILLKSDTKFRKLPENHDFIPHASVHYQWFYMQNKFNETLVLHDNVTGILQLDQSNKMAYKDPGGCDTYNGKFYKVSTKRPQCIEKRTNLNIIKLTFMM
jgi:hypothetical protein